MIKAVFFIIELLLLNFVFQFGCNYIDASKIQIGTSLFTSIIKIDDLGRQCSLLFCHYISTLPSDCVIKWRQVTPADITCTSLLVFFAQGDGHHWYDQVFDLVVHHSNVFQIVSSLFNTVWLKWIIILYTLIAEHVWLCFLCRGMQTLRSLCSLCWWTLYL